jgi:DNA-binding response OmpR family regulator
MRVVDDFHLASSAEDCTACSGDTGCSASKAPRERPSVSALATREMRPHPSLSVQSTSIEDGADLAGFPAKCGTPDMCLTANESQLLELLIIAAGSPISSEDLLNKLYPETTPCKTTLKVHIHNLRRKTRLCPEFRIVTVLNQGYALSQ